MDYRGPSSAARRVVNAWVCPVNDCAPTCALSLSKVPPDKLHLTRSLLQTRQRAVDDHDLVRSDDAPVTSAQACCRSPDQSPALTIAKLRPSNGHPQVRAAMGCSQCRSESDR